MVALEGASEGRRGQKKKRMRDMKMLFVNPFQVRLVAKKGRIYNRTWTPLDLAYCAAQTREAGIETAILDANAEQMSPEEVAERARGYDKVFITSTSLDRWQCPNLDLQPFFENVDAIRRVAPEIHVMGSHGTVKPEEILAETQATTVIRGEPEITSLQLAKGACPNEVLGITYMKDGEVVHQPDQKAVHMDDLPLPAFDLLPMNRYHYEVMGDNFTLFEMSRGCASNCNFCLLETYGAGVRRKHVPKLIAEVEYAIKEFGVKTAYFIDLEFTVLRKQVVEFCEYLIEAKHDFKWCIQTRLDLVDEEILQLMKRAGCTLIHFGVEAGSDRILETTRKGVSLQQIRDGMALCHKVGIRSATFFMFGFLESTEEDMRDIERLAGEINPDYPLFHIAAPYPGTELYERAKNDPHARFSDDTLFPEAVEANFTLQQLKNMTRRAYISYYARPGYIFSRLLRGDFGALWQQSKLFASLIRG
jgi:radical SAM superfamily enzyme YgiQ (UPF0313 family)